MNWIKLHKKNYGGEEGQEDQEIWVDATNIAWMETFRYEHSSNTYLYWKAIGNRHNDYLEVSETDDYILSVMRAVDNLNKESKNAE